MGVILIIHFNIFIIVRYRWLKVAINKVVLHKYQIYANFGESDILNLQCLFVTDVLGGGGRESPVKQQAIGLFYGFEEIIYIKATMCLSVFTFSKLLSFT
jgi:hypothetical protein